MTPDVINDGDPVDVEISGFTEPTALAYVVICPSTVVQTGYRYAACGILSASPRLPSHVVVRPRGIFLTQPAGPPVNCALVAGGCVIGVVQSVSGGGVQEAYAPVASTRPWPARPGAT